MAKKSKIVREFHLQKKVQKYQLMMKNLKVNIKMLVMKDYTKSFIAQLNLWI